jgi:alkylation response protein AidB-like acyl-CoA dehydrogenase
MGLRASSTAALEFDKVRVPRANLLGAPGDGLKILLASLNKSRPSIAAHALGIAIAAFKDMTAYMNTRRQSGRRIAEFQGNQFLLAISPASWPCARRGSTMSPIWSMRARQTSAWRPRSPSCGPATSPCA